MEQIDSELRRQMIAEAAYFRAERRAFGRGDPVADWLAAEHEIDTQLGKHKLSHSALDERLAAVNERLKAFRQTLADLGSEAREEYEADVEKLRRLRDRLRMRIKEAGRQGGHAAELAKSKAEKVWDEIGAVTERLSRRKTRR